MSSEKQWGFKRGFMSHKVQYHAVDWLVIKKTALKSHLTRAEADIIEVVHMVYVLREEHLLSGRKTTSLRVRIVSCGKTMYVCFKRNQCSLFLR